MKNIKKTTLRLQHHNQINQTNDIEKILKQLGVWKICSSQRNKYKGYCCDLSSDTMQSRT